VFVLLPERVAHLAPVCWTPIDHDPVPPKVVRFLRDSGARPVALSRFGQAQLQKADLDGQYVPHGVDTSVFAPHADRAAVREAMGVPEGAFVVGMVAANTGNTPPRKAFPQVFQAFAELHRKHPDSILFLHTEVTGKNMGVDMLRLAEACGIPAEAVGSSDQLLLKLGFIGPEDMALVYATMDVLANPSMGEGFGIPIVEAQACGVPVIVSDHSAMPELCGAGWVVGGDKAWNESQASWFVMPSVGEVTDALLAAYDGAADLRLQAEAFAQDYDADTVLHRHWLPVLEKLEKPREVGPIVRPNRAARRAKKGKRKVAA
jgi:glycosyltransferase involved in cell wall biosynthesis